MGRPLLRAGLEEVSATALPMWAARAGIYDPAWTGRKDAFVAHDDPHRIERGNSGWYELATTCGLFDADRQFLLTLPTYALSAQKLHAPLGHRRRGCCPVGLYAGYPCRRRHLRLPVPNPGKPASAWSPLPGLRRVCTSINGGSRPSPG